MNLTQIDKNPDEVKKKSGLQPGEAVEIAGLVNYSDDSIVSRTLVNNDAGTITLFAFDEGQGLSEHTAPFDAIVQIIDGESEITIDGKPVKAVDGQLILMPANVPHSLKATRKFKMILTMLRK